MILINLIASLLPIFLLFFLQVVDEVEGGILYVDSRAGEALHSMGALPFIVRLGVRVVCSLENASPFCAVRTLMEPRRAAKKWWCSPHTSSVMHIATFFDACVVTLMCGVVLCSHLFLRFQFIFAPCLQPFNSFRLCSHPIFIDNLSNCR